MSAYSAEDKEADKEKYFHEICAESSSKHMSAVWHIESLFIKNCIYVCLATFVVSLLVLSHLDVNSISKVVFWPVYTSWVLGVVSLVLSTVMMFLTTYTKHLTANLYFYLSLKMPSKEQGGKEIERIESALKLDKKNQYIYPAAILSSAALILQIVFLLVFVSVNAVSFVTTVGS